MRVISNKTLTGERAAYASVDTEFRNCVFEDGESPLKESRNIKVVGCSFGWKYPLWYVDGAQVQDTRWLPNGRSGVWYTRNLSVSNCLIGAPKQFRRCSNVTLVDCSIPCAEETLWHCQDVSLTRVHVVGDYFGMNCKNVKITNCVVDGNYCFDGGENIEAEGCTFNSKDSFWNCKNVIIRNSIIIGEYLAWNSQNVTFENCTLESHQGLCYIDTLTLRNCEMFHTDLAFERCRNVDAEVVTTVDSIKNPYNGRIVCRGFGELILDEKVVDPTQTVIEVKND